MKCYLFQSKQAWINKSIFFSENECSSFQFVYVELTNSGLLRVSVLRVQSILRQMQKEAYWKVNANVTMGTKATPRETSLVQVTIIHWKRNEHVLALKKKHRFAIWSLHKSVPNRTQRSNVRHARGDQFCTPCSNFPRWISKENCCLAKQAKAK